MFTIFISEFTASALGTARLVSLNKNRNFMSSLIKAIGTGLSVVAIGALIANPSVATVLTLCGASFLGSYIPSMMFNKPQYAY